MNGRSLLDEDDDDPLLSLVNLVDVFLVVVAALMLTLAAHPLNPFGGEKVTLIRNAGQADMEIVVRDGQRIEHYRAADRPAGGTRGVKAGVAYRMPDGSMVYVPE